MANVYDLIQRALEERLSAFSSLPSGGVAWENVEFKPTEGTAWCRAFISPSEVSRKTLGEDGYSRVDGVFLVTLYYPKNQGSGACRRVADALAQWFKSGTRLTAGVVTVTCSSARRAAALTDDPKWYQIPVQVFWYTHRNEL